MDKLKTYFVEVLMKKVGPQVSAALVSALLAFLAAHQQILEQMGITYFPDFTGVFTGTAPTGRLIVVELDTLTVWGGMALVGGAVALWGIIQHHAAATVTGAPQSGDIRATPNTPTEGGQRATDPQKGAI